MTAKTRNRDMWKNIPWERRAQIAQKIKRMPDGLWHHMIPAKMGGTAERENMICLCHDCHKAITDYHRRIFGKQKNK